jgi:translation initiation factor 6
VVILVIGVIKLAIHLLDIYRSSNIGIFLKSNENHLLIPHGLAKTKIEKLTEYLSVESIEISIGGSRLLGPLIAMNNNGILVSKLADKNEITLLKKSTGLPVERLQSKYTSVGNLISANDRGVIASTLLKDVKNQIVDVLNVPIEFLTIASFDHVGAFMVSGNVGSAIHPQASDGEITKATKALKVAVEPITINRGLPFIASGIILSKTKAVVGSLTTGPELIMLSRVFKL